MKDFIGRELAIGDEVIYLDHNRTSSNLCRGVIVGFTPMKVKIDHYSVDGRQLWMEMKYPQKIVKVSWTDVI